MGLQVSRSVRAQTATEGDLRPMRSQLGAIFHALAKQKEKECQILEGHLMPDHVHMCLAIPPKHPVASVIGFLQPTLSNPDYPATGRIPSYNKEIAPRIGFAYSLDQQGNTVFRGGYGIFYGRYPGGLINTFFLGNGLYQKSISLNSSNASDKANGPLFPNVLPNTGNFNPPAGSVSLNIAAADFRSPYTQQADLAIERQLAKDLALTVSYI